MKNIELINKNKLQVNDKIISFENEIIRKYKVFDNLCIVIFDVVKPEKDKYYNNVIAIDIPNEFIIWEIEKNKKLDKQNPYTSVFDSDFYFIFQKSNDTRYAVNKKNGEIIKNINLNTGNRPW